MTDINPVWIAVFFSVVVQVIGWILAARAARHGTELALGRYEERQHSQGQALGRLEDQVIETSRTVGEHGRRIAVLENEMDLRPPPLDYPRRT